MNALAKQVSLLRWAAHYDGWPLTALRVVSKASSLVGLQRRTAAWIQELSEKKFDSRFNVHTRGFVAPDNLQLPADRVEHAVEYTPTSGARFGWLMSRLPLDLSKYVFVDVGSGKGRVLLMASEFPLKRIIGIELSQELHETALQNIRRFRSQRQQCDDVIAINEDATQFEFPAEPLVLFFFNPFSAEILRLVIDNLQQSLSDHPRSVVVIYYNALHESVLDQYQEFQPAPFGFDPGSDWRVYSTKD